MKTKCTGSIIPKVPPEWVAKLHSDRLREHIDGELLRTLSISRAPLPHQDVNVALRASEAPPRKE